MAYNNIISIHRTDDDSRFSIINVSQSFENNAIKFYAEFVTKEGYSFYNWSVDNQLAYTLDKVSCTVQNTKIVFTKFGNFASIYFEIPLTKNDIGKKLSMLERNSFGFRTTSIYYKGFAIEIDTVIPANWFNEPPTINGGRGGTTDLGNLLTFFL